MKFKFHLLDFEGVCHGGVTKNTDLNCFTEVDMIEVAPQDGVFIYGVYIEQAIWDRDT